MKRKPDDPENSNVILFNCCLVMGKRFQHAACTYDKRGEHVIATKLRTQAKEQFAALRRVIDDLKPCA